jgi:DNA-binding CsgD family transcriptional regulator
MELVGRSVELEVLTSLLEKVAEGSSAALVLRGDLGVGKTALLEAATAKAAADGIRSARVTGVEAETQLGYAALHRLLLPFWAAIERLPKPQRDALHSTFGLIGGPPADRFLVALSVLTLLADAASLAPLLCVIDDVQWLDPESAIVLGFVARRLQAERVVMLFAAREVGEVGSALSGIPELEIGGLSKADAAELLAQITRTQLNPGVESRLFAESRGNPLALIELAAELTSAQLVGAVALPDPLPAVDALLEVFGRRHRRLSHDARLLLAVAAAEPTASGPIVWRAAERLGVDPDLAERDTAAMVSLRPDIQFRHPLARSVAYHGIPTSERRLVHRALAEVTDAAVHPDRAAWHMAMAADGPDDAVATQLELAAERTSERGGYAATATFLTRAAEYSADEHLRIGRLLAAAEAELTAGSPARASALLDGARRGSVKPPPGPVLRLAGQISLATGRLTDAPSQLLSAAQTLMQADASLGREILLYAMGAANYAGRDAVRRWCTVAAEILPGASAAAPASTIVDLLLFGFLHWFAGEYEQAAPLLRSVITRLRDEDSDERARLSWMEMGCFAASELLDDEARTALADEFARLARRRGALTALPMALTFVGEAAARAGRFDQADAAHAEGREISAATGNPGISGKASPQGMLLLVWRDHGEEARAAGAEIMADMAERGVGAGVSYVHTWLAVLEVGLGNYREALDHAKQAYREDSLGTGCFALPELVEAACRCGEPDVARQALDRLSARARAGGAPWGLGLLARSHALLADDGRAEGLYREAIGLFGSTRAGTDLARAHLVYGEWLRRQRRRRDAREHLRTAYDMLTGMGADGFAKRARAELAATGEHARKRDAGPTPTLTPQEAQVARLIAGGQSNRDVAAQLFISPATVEYHLRKVYQKLGVTSRTQLARTLTPEAAAE